MKKIILLYFLIFGVLNLYSQGRILLIGGGSERTGQNSWNYQAFRWLTDNAQQKKVAVIGYESGGSTLVSYFTQYWGASYAKEFIINSSNANSQSLYDELITYDIVYIRGGDQYYYYTYYKGKKVQQALEYIYNNGGAIAGTSAGMHILLKVIFTDDTGYSIYPDEAIENPRHSYITLHNDFLNFLPGFVGDSHIAERGRLPRLIGFMANWKFLNNQIVVGIGVDDQTAVAIESNKIATVYGSGTVSICIAENNTFSQNPPTTGKLLVRNLKIIQLKQGNKINLNTFEVITSPENTTNLQISQENTPLNIFLSGGDELTDNVAMLNSFLSQMPSLNDSILVLTGSNQTLAQNYRTKLMELGATKVYVRSATSDQGTNSQLASEIFAAKGFVYVGSTYSEFTGFLNTNNGVLLKNRLLQSNVVSAFVGDNSRFAGKIVIDNYLTELASYNASLTFGEGLGLLKTTVVMPNTFYNSNMYENALTGVPYAMNQYGLAYGVWLYKKNYMRYYVTNNNAYFHGFGSAPVMVLRNTSTKWGHVTQTPSGIPPARQISAYDQMYMEFIDDSTPLKVGQIAASDEKISKSFVFYPNPSFDKIYFEKQFSEIELYNINGVKIKEDKNTRIFELSTLPAGIYLLKVKDADGKWLTQKIVKN